MSRSALEVDALTWDGCMELAKTMRRGDVLECEANGHAPHIALCAGLIFGASFGVYDKDHHCRGAFGFNTSGGIWSLWSDLSRRESVQVLRGTPQWVREMVSLSGLDKLENFVDTENKVALDWLRASGVFQIGETIHQIGGRSFLHFTTDGMRVNV